MSLMGHSRRFSRSTGDFRSSPGDRTFVSDRRACLKGARNGLMHRSNSAALFDHLVGALGPRCHQC